MYCRLISAVPPLAAHLAAAQIEQRVPITQLKPMCGDPHSFAPIACSTDAELCAEYALAAPALTGRLVPCGEQRVVAQVEDKAAVDKDALLHQPMVMVYDKADKVGCSENFTTVNAVSII